MVWNIPYPHNPFFTGRKELLSRLQKQLRKGQKAALSQPQAVSGLGGIGKTQIAIEYAHKHRQKYQSVLWARAESHEALTSSFVEIARLLDLPQKDEQDQTIIVQAVKRWLQDNHGWLLILDNADEPVIIREFLPTKCDGHILLTTRAQALGGLAQRIEVDTFTNELGALFLLRRATIIAADATAEQALAQDREVAMKISEELGGLPLALDQAGAYVEETSCSLSDYLNLYRTRRAEVLKERGGLLGDHPDSVATTWSLSFQRVEEKNAAAADLLRLCAFLAPDAIPEEIITKGAEHLGPVLQAVSNDSMALNKAIAALGAYSLIQRDATEKTLSIHRLVQAVLQDVMSDDETKMWAERAVLAVSEACPDVEFEVWKQWERYLPHAQAACNYLKWDQMALPEEVTLLLNKIGWYLRERGRYREAEALLQQIVIHREHNLGPEHLDTAKSLNSLGLLYWDQGKYREAESLFIRALAIHEQQWGLEHLDTAKILNNLALLYESQGKYRKAEPLHQQVLAIKEQKLGVQDPSVSISLNNLAMVYESQDKYVEAEPLYQRALAIREKVLGPQHPNTATSLNNLAYLYCRQEKYTEAKLLYQRALTIREKQLGPDHPKTAGSLNNLAELYHAQSQYEQAELLYQRALTIREKQLRPDHPDTATTLNNLAKLYESRGKYEQAEPLYQRAIAIYEQSLGPQHLNTQQARQNYAALLRAMGRDAEAKQLEE